jgi:hypothetical protein
MKNLVLKSAVAIATSVILFSCKKESGNSATVVKEWNVNLSARFENPAPAGRNETGVANIKLMSDNSLSYSFSVMGLASGDALTAAHFHVGNAGATGGVILNFNPTFSGSSASGTIMNVRQTLVDSLKSDANEIYLNIHSSQVAAGIVRGQVNSNVEFAADIALSGANEVPAVNTSATGTARIRVTANKKLYSIVAVNNLQSGDAVTAAHIHSGAAGTNGAVLQGIAANAADFAVEKVFTLSDAIYNSLKADALYVNVHSTLYASGVVRGQIR